VYFYNNDHDHGEPSYNWFFFVICLFYEKQRQIYEQFILGMNNNFSQHSCTNVFTAVADLQVQCL
jgi:hypothetical protein